MRFFSLPIILLAMTPLWACSSPGGSASGSTQVSSAGATALLASTFHPGNLCASVPDVTTVGAISGLALVEPGVSNIPEVVTGLTDPGMEQCKFTISGEIGDYSTSVVFLATPWSGSLANYHSSHGQRGTDAFDTVPGVENADSDIDLGASWASVGGAVVSVSGGMSAAARGKLLAAWVTALGAQKGGVSDASTASPVSSLPDTATSLLTADNEKIRSRFCLGYSDANTNMNGPGAFERAIFVLNFLGPIVPSNVAADYKDVLQSLTIYRDLLAHYGDDKNALLADPKFSKFAALTQATNRFNTWMSSLC